jgi:uncharacterized RDD family membrane protein YckC
MTTDTGQIDWGHWVVRLVAFIIDGILLAIVAAIIGGILAIAAFFGGGFGFFFGTVGFFAFSFIWGVLSFLYFMILDSYWGATIGKRVMGLQVQTINGGRIPLDKSFIRNISKIFWLFLLLDWIIGIASPGDKRQKFLDRTAGVVVVQTRQAFTTAPPPPPPPPT